MEISILRIIFAPARLWRDAQGNTMSTYTFDMDTFRWAEAHIYGSSRIGVYLANKDLVIGGVTQTSALAVNERTNVRGKRNYELANHLGNVLVVISDKRQGVCSQSGLTNYQAEIVSATDYYSFGSAMPGREYTMTEYRYGFNGMEKDNKISEDNYDFGARIYDGRLGRWLSLDPLMAKYPSFSPYCGMINSPLNVIDVDGRDIIILHAEMQNNRGDGANGDKHPTSHLAILIQGKDENGNSGWWFYSHDGPGENGSDGITKKFFNSIEEFTKSEYNTMKKNYDDGKGFATSEKDKDGFVRTRFTNAIRITTNAETDKKMNDAATKQLKKKYRLFSSDCRHVVYEAINSSNYYIPKPTLLPRNYFDIIKNLIPNTKVDTKHPLSKKIKFNPLNIPNVVKIKTPPDNTRVKPKIPIKKPL